jgi:phage-related protein
MSYADARLEAGFLLRRLQNGEKLSLPQSRPMPVVGSSCHELRIRDVDQTWRVIYSIENDAVVILEVFSKKTTTTPNPVITTCQRRLRLYRDL